MNKKDEALAKFVEVVKNLSSKEFEEKYVKEDIPVSKLLIRTKGVWKGNLKVINDMPAVCFLPAEHLPSSVQSQ